MPAFDILNLIHKAAAAMSPLVTSFVQLVYFAVLIVLIIELFSPVSRAPQQPQLRGGGANLSGGRKRKTIKIFNEGEGKLQYAV